MNYLKLVVKNISWVVLIFSSKIYGKVWELFENYSLESKNVIWATSWENLFVAYANNKGADQAAHPRSLISAFVVRWLDG